MTKETGAYDQSRSAIATVDYGRRVGLCAELMEQLRDARAEHASAVAEVMTEFHAEIAELRGELVAQINATIAQVKAKYEKEVATLQRQLAEARAELSKHQMLDASRSGNDNDEAELRACTHKPVWSKAAGNVRYSTLCVLNWDLA